jgi:hypothetical protein
MQTADDLNTAITPEQVPPPGLKPGRNIVLLSDGTGNSSAKLNKTNVWRLYQALELEDGTQLAFYDNGVGTSGFKPLRILGGAIGLGLARNVRDLYRSLCQHYRAPDENHAGDRIYVFGFSRGAFTARILVDLITSCGILDLTKSVPRRGFIASRTSQVPLSTDEGLVRGVELAYKAYRRKYTAPLFARVYRILRDKVFGAVPDTHTFRQSYSYASDEPIEAVGVWDTVSAYGLPVEEMTDLIDKLFFKLRFEEHNLNHKVRHAYHALAIDDERQSFRPLLWNENGEESPERIQQVWFAGMHSDVGGGYPNGALALHSLNWMINALKRKPGAPDGLVFSDQALERVLHSAATTAPMHDSRSGVGVYYRYKPRIVADLIQDHRQNVYIKTPKIHDSVLTRIALDSEGYSPPALPLTYEVIDSQGLANSSDHYEQGSNRDHRKHCQDRALRHIFWRRVNYFLMVVTTLALFLMPYYQNRIHEPDVSGFQGVIVKLLSTVALVLPDFFTHWTVAWTQSPLLFTALTLILIGLILYARKVARFIHLLAEAGWSPVKQSPERFHTPPAKGFYEGLADRAFENRFILGLLELTDRSLMWLVVGLGLLLLLR